MPEIPITAVRFDEEHKALLRACADEERTSMTEVLKRALRAYAKSIGVAIERPGRKRTKKR